MLNFFAHEELTNTPVDFFDTVNGQVILNFTPFVLLALILFLMHRLKLKQTWTISFTLVYLLLTGLLSYRFIPVASVVSIVAGFGLSLAWAIQPLSRISKRRK